MLLLLLLPGLPLLQADQWGKGRKGSGAGAAANPGSRTRFRHPDPRYRLEVQSHVMVEEGQCVFVPCGVSYPREGWNDYTPAHGYWFRSGATALQDALVATNNPGHAVTVDTEGRFHLLGDPKTYNCSLDIRDAQRTDTGTYFFRMERGSSVRFNFKWNQISVKVTALSRTPVLHIQGTLDSGYPKNITCTVPWACERGTPPIFSWIRVTGTSLGSRIPYSSVLMLTPRPQDHGTNLTCQVKFPAAGVTVKETIVLNVSYAPQNLTISVFYRESTEMKYVANGSSVLVLEGDSLRLVCVTESNPPAILSWAQGSRTLSPSPLSDPGVLELPQIQREHEGEFTCRAQHPRGSLHVSLHLSVHYPPQLLKPSCFWEDEGLHCSCSSRAQPAPSLHWWLEERLLEGNFSNASFKVTSSSTGSWGNTSLSLRGQLCSSLRLECEAQNDHGKQRVTILLLPG